MNLNFCISYFSFYKNFEKNYIILCCNIEKKNFYGKSVTLYCELCKTARKLDKNQTEKNTYMYCSISLIIERNFQSSSSQKFIRHSIKRNNFFHTWQKPSDEGPRLIQNWCFPYLGWKFYITKNLPKFRQVQAIIIKDNNNKIINKSTK